MTTPDWVLTPAQQLLVHMRPEASWVTGPDGRLSEVSDSACILYQQSREELLGKYPHELVADSVERILTGEADPARAVTFAFWSDTRATERLLAGETVYHEVPVQLPDGSEMLTAACVRARWGEAGTMVGYEVWFSLVEQVQRDLPGSHPADDMQAALAEVFGPRLRSQSRQHLEAAVHALRSGEGGTIVLRVPPASTNPVELSLWAYTAQVAVREDL